MLIFFISIVSAMAIFMAFASLLRYDHWAIRMFDFPRLQISVILVVCIVGCLYIYDFDSAWHILVIVLLIIGLAHELRRIYPYTILKRKEVLNAIEAGTDHEFSLLVSNVLMSNSSYQKILNHIEHYQPDVVLTLETNTTWERELRFLHSDYPHRVAIPKENYYGMHLYSKLPLIDPQVRYIIEKEVPSIEAWVELRSKQRIKIFCLHPKPPSPSENKTSVERDAELLLIGKEVSKLDVPTLVFGDLNDVAWSKTTQLFRKISRLLDPRIGRGFFNTFHAGVPILRWPLDHVFHSADFACVRLKRLSSIGSDHFPIYARLKISSRAETLHEEPVPDKEDQELAQEKIENGKEKH